MDLKLNIYKNQREIEKTYTVDTYDVMYGPVEDLLNILDVEALLRQKGDASMVAAIGKLVTGSRGMFNALMKDIFPGLTDDELRRVKVKELIAVVVGLAGFSMDEIKLLYDTGKKALEGQVMR